MGRLLAVLIGLGAVSGCGRSYSVCSGGMEMVDAEIDLSGEVPVFDWEFGTVYALSVYEQVGEGREMWHIQCGGDNLENDDRFEEQVCIETPIAYGEEVDAPNLDTVNLTRAKTLKPGVTYLVMMSTMIEDDGPEVESDTPDWMDFLVDDEEQQDDAWCGSGFSAETVFVAGSGQTTAD